MYAGGDSSGGRQTRNGVAVCSQKRALCVTAIVLGALLGTALVIAYAGPQNGMYVFVLLLLSFDVCYGQNILY